MQMPQSRSSSSPILSARIAPRFTIPSNRCVGSIQRRSPYILSTIRLLAIALRNRRHVAAECSSQQGRFEAMHDLLFEWQSRLGTVTWSDFATEVGIPDLDRFLACVESK